MVWKSGRSLDRKSSILGVSGPRRVQNRSNKWRGGSRNRMQRCFGPAGPPPKRRCSVAKSAGFENQAIPLPDIKHLKLVLGGAAVFSGVLPSPTPTCPRSQPGRGHENCRTRPGDAYVCSSLSLPTISPGGAIALAKRSRHTSELTLCNLRFILFLSLSFNVSVGRLPKLQFA